MWPPSCMPCCTPCAFQLEHLESAATGIIVRVAQLEVNVHACLCIIVRVAQLEVDVHSVVLVQCLESCSAMWWPLLHANMYPCPSCKMESSIGRDVAVELELERGLRAQATPIFAWHCWQW